MPRGFAWKLAVALLAAIAVARIVATYRVFNQVVDEPFHVACGMEALQKHSYQLEPLHPPLARLAVALGPYRVGLRIGNGDALSEGNRVLYGGRDYLTTLALARLGTLPFFLLAVGCVAWLAHELFGEIAAVAAVLLFTILPAVLAHAGVATTDMAVTATVALALIFFVRWWEKPTQARAVWFGIGAGLAVLSKLSALVFSPAAIVAIVAADVAVGRQERANHKRHEGHTKDTAGRVAARPALRGFGWVVLAGFLTLWAGYGFSFHRARGENPPRNAALGAMYRVATSVPIPAPAFVRGVRMLADSQAHGRRSYLLGEARTGGWWYFFPVAVFYKTPLGFLILAVGGIALTLRRSWVEDDFRLAVPAAAALGIFGVSLLSRIDIGLRHVLPMFPFLAVCAGAAVGRAVRDTKAPNLTKTRLGWGTHCVVVLALVVWVIVASVRAHPDYLAYFNEAAGAHPENILVDSDLDWGQDLLRLGAELRHREIDSVSIVYFGSARLDRAGLPRYRVLAPGERATGWIAASLYMSKMGDLHAEDCGGYCWLNDVPEVARAGRSIRLLYVAPR